MFMDIVMGAAMSPDVDKLISKPMKTKHASVVAGAAQVPGTWRPFAACVVDRESGGDLDTRTGKGSGERAANPTSSARGRWQFMKPWQRGGSFMVRDRLIRFGMPKKDAKALRRELEFTPIDEWSGYLQDVLAVEVLTQHDGWYHWKYNDKCDRLRPGAA